MSPARPAGELQGGPVFADDLPTRLHAAMINVALRVAVEHQAFHETPATSEAVFEPLRGTLAPAVRCLEEARPRST